MMSPDPDVFSEKSIPKEIAALNEKILRDVEGTPTYEEMGATAAKALRAKELKDGDPTRYQDVVIGSGNVNARIFFPMAGTKSRGALLHIHGGGYVFGTAKGQNDIRLQRHAENCAVSIISVDYRLSPANVFPAASDDCVAVAAWLQTSDGRKAMRVEEDSPLLMVGESAGANLGASILPCIERNTFKAVVLVYGWYDLSELPFLKQWGKKRLVESSDDLRWFRSQYLGPDFHGDLKDPKISPLYANLAGLPPALFVIGTEDALLDDSLFMHARWIASGNESTLKVYPGAAHGMGHFGPHQHTAQGEQVLQDIEAFYKQYL